MEPNDWVSSMVVVLKGGKICICIDSKDLNKAIRREHYPIPMVEEVLAGMPNAKDFSVIDAKSGFLQIKLDYISSLVMTFNTPDGWYRWLHLPFRKKSVPEIYQHIMDSMLEGIRNCWSIMDDVLVATENPEEHDAVMKKCTNSSDSYSIYQSSFLRSCSSAGSHKEWYSVLLGGTSTRQFWLTCVRKPQCYYNPKKPLPIQCNASKYAVGRALFQDDQPIAYTSWALTQTEVNWNVGFGAFMQEIPSLQIWTWSYIREWPHAVANDI